MRRFLLLWVAALSLFTGSLCAQNTPIKNLAPTGDLTPLVTAIESARLYPVFILPLGGGYYDFEIKGTLTNFTGTSPADVVYIFATATAQRQPSYPGWDSNPKVFFCNPEANDGRSWVSANVNNSLFSQVGANTNSRLNHVVFIPSKISSSSTWMYKGNVNLVWSYCRISPNGPEKDSLNNIVWSPIIPSDWRLSQTTP